MGSVFGYGCVSFDESLRTTMHYVIVRKYLHHVAFGRRIDIIYQLDVWIYYSRLKWLVYFGEFRIIDMLGMWLNKRSDNFDWFKSV